MSQVKTTGENPMIKKRISVSQKRQITIPMISITASALIRKWNATSKTTLSSSVPFGKAAENLTNRSWQNLITKVLPDKNCWISLKKPAAKVRPAV